ncbi:hypothetical protein IVB14_05165 [Bradyrhizobium sp. 180]|uniref:hypothetical protein n=1 Tax=unclassified Bradyrhizobium TaxID=2631580 RepID=UPI001FFB2BF8|nr:MULTISPECIES: hypothetical protein [unclassified Bradyrhizobium]MCK1420716.1 hypothetical protein [Bradyrhizobium sp. CW12]MCK1489827.1 hypothetical protein [Bradyrhizobium sp. 180]MCK1532389.1 hypothetical protein [Bradyrhizobium sp. 182]MCK1595647.1 hypothetical protein [Bradyrhizobium sp. 164]MCK1647313.1 hypothetical protein [Bradyrhizobium sp. 154]
MALLKKKPADEFIVPSLADSSPEFAALIAKRQELEQNYAKLNTERSKLLEEIKAAKAAGGEHLNSSVARILGDAAKGSIGELSKRLRDIVTEMSNIEDAREVLYRRTGEARDKASKIVCSAVRHEYKRRLAALCDAARALEAAREDHDALIDDLEREDVRLGYLAPITPHFMGDRREGRIFHFLKEVREKGYNV